MSDKPDNQDQPADKPTGDKDVGGPPRPEQIWPPPEGKDAEQPADAAGFGWDDDLAGQIDDTIEELRRINGDASAPTPPSDAPPPAMRVRERADGEIGQLWSNVFLAGGRAAPRVIVVTGARRGDGATQIACALALFGASANEELRVALVDGNLRDPGVARALGLPDSPGLADVLSGAATIEAAVQTVSLDSVHCLYVLTAGSKIARPLSLLRSRQVKSIVGRMRDRYDHVIIDAADATSHPDAQILGGLCDGALLVVRAGKTPRETAGEIKKRLDLAGVRCLGLVLNQRTDPIPDMVYRRT